MKYIGLLIMACIIGTAGSAQNQSEIKWLSFEELSWKMKIHPKKVLLFFYEENCVYCRKMEEVTFKNSAVVNELNSDYYVVKMDAHTTQTIRIDGQKFTNPKAEKTRFPIHQLAAVFIKRKGYQVSFPVTVFLNENFEVVNRSFVYLSPKAMMRFLKT